MLLRIAVSAGLFAVESALKVSAFIESIEQMPENLKWKAIDLRDAGARRLIGEGTFFESLVEVTSYTFPEPEVLKEEFQNVDDIDPADEWVNHPSVEETPGQKRFRPVYFDRKINGDEVIAYMDSRGYRPANHVELRFFARRNPRILRVCMIVAPGSFMISRGKKYYAYALSTSPVSSSDKDLVLSVTCADRERDGQTALLFVRK